MKTKLDIIKFIKKTFKNKKFIVSLLIILAVILTFVISLYFNVPQNIPEEYVEQEPEKPRGYDFDELRKLYPEIIAWLIVPNTAIDTPICCNDKDDAYYLKHDASQNYDINGVAYIEAINSKDFSDQITVVYGHTMHGDIAFTPLHKFEDQLFFDANTEFYIWIPGHKYTYKIAASYVFSNLHILKNSNYKDKTVVHSYFENIKNPSYQNAKVRDVGINDDSKIVQFSTCLMDPSIHNKRYIVTGVLEREEETEIYHDEN